jgi:hypothetical protein
LDTVCVIKNEKQDCKIVPVEDEYLWEDGKMNVGVEGKMNVGVEGG